MKLAEQKLQGKNVNSAQLNKVFQPWLDADYKPDTVVLGCTHFPLLRDEIESCLGNQVTLVDSGNAVADRVHKLLNGISQIAGTEHQAYYTKPYSEQQLSVLEESFSRYGFKWLNLFER